MQENDPPERGEWRTATPKHAIERASFALTFSEALPAKIFAQVLALVGTKAANAGIKDIFSMPTILINVGPIQGPNNAPPAQGQIFRKSLPAGSIEKEIMCNIQELRFTTTDYHSWLNFIGEISDCFSQATDKLLNAVSIREIRIEYWDLFSREVTKRGPGDQLLNEHSILIPAFFAAQEDSWHAHVGFFRSEVPGAASLINANVDVITAQQAREVLASGVEAQARLYTAARIQVQDEGCFVDWEAVKTAADVHHELLKSLLGNIINPDLTKVIGLDAKPFIP